MSMNPILLKGIWDDGYALDYYISKSVCLGEDAFGHLYFDNTYTDIGKLLYSMKYNGHNDTSAEIITTCGDFVRSWIENKEIDIILPVPPSIQREFQPVFIIAQLLAEYLDIPYSDDVLVKTTDIVTKNIPKAERRLANTGEQLKPAKRKCNILLVDDFYSTGNTATECVSVLKEDIFIDKVYYLAIVKTK